MTLPDNSIRLPAGRIDFANTVGLTGQDHDNYPAPGQQPRYDWLRMFLVGLLSCQSSHHSPTQYRAGTLWFDLGTNMLRVWSGVAWVSLADAIEVRPATDPAGELSLTQWFNSLSGYLSTFSPEVYFEGQATADTNIIPIPSALQPGIGTSPRAFVHRNGLLIDPFSCSVSGAPPSAIILAAGSALVAGDGFSVNIRNIQTQYFWPHSVSVP